MNRDEHLALLEDQHAFPGTYRFRAFSRPDDTEAIVAAVTAALAPEGRIVDVGQRASRGGRWVALQLEAHVVRAEQVLDVYTVLHALDEVVQTL